MISSLMSGLPIRWICEKDPDGLAGSGARRTVSRGREVVPQAPMVAAGLVDGTIVPVLVSMAMGTSMAMVFTL